MKDSERLGRAGRTALTVALSIGGACGPEIARAQDDPVIHACVLQPAGLPRIVGDPNACIGAIEESTSWNVAGPAGPAGPPGAAGAVGPAGPPGPPTPPRAFAAYLVEETTVVGPQSVIELEQVPVGDWIVTARIDISSPFGGEVTVTCELGELGPSNTYDEISGDNPTTLVLHRLIRFDEPLFRLSVECHRSRTVGFSTAVVGIRSLTAVEVLDVTP